MAPVGDVYDWVMVISVTYIFDVSHGLIGSCTAQPFARHDSM